MPKLSKKVIAEIRDQTLEEVRAFVAEKSIMYGRTYSWDISDVTSDSEHALTPGDIGQVLDALKLREPVWGWKFINRNTK